MSLPKTTKDNLTLEQIKLRQAKWVKNWRDKNPEKQILARKRAYINRKIKAMNLVGGAKCVLCGCEEIDFLEFNHKHGGGSKEYRDGNRMAMMDKLLTNKREIEGLEILCRICNALDFLKRKNKEQSKRYKVTWN